MTGPAPAWHSATTLLDELHRNAEGVAVLRAAFRSGPLAALLRPTTVEDVVALTGVARARVVAVLGVLESFGVATSSGGAWSLTDGWTAMLRDESPVPTSSHRARRGRRGGVRGR